MSQHHLISVTGTLGIGKSLFYLYFFKKYRESNPEKKVLTASFSKERQLEECVLWNSPNDTDEEEFKYLDKVPRNACDLYLYDGPPHLEPLGSSKMVAFTSPNAIWFSITSKYAEHIKV